MQNTQTTLEDIIEDARTKLHEQGFTTRIDDDAESMVLSVRTSIVNYIQKYHLVNDILTTAQLQIDACDISALKARFLTRSKPNTGVPNILASWRWVAALGVNYTQTHARLDAPLRKSDKNSSLQLTLKG